MPTPCSPSLGIPLLPRKAILPEISPIIRFTGKKGGLFGDAVDAEISHSFPNTLERHACQNQGFDGPA